MRRLGTRRPARSLRPSGRLGTRRPARCRRGAGCRRIAWVRRRLLPGAPDGTNRGALRLRCPVAATVSPRKRSRSDGDRLRSADALSKRSPTDGDRLQFDDAPSPAFRIGPAAGPLTSPTGRSRRAPEGGAGGRLNARRAAARPADGRQRRLGRRHHARRGTSGRRPAGRVRARVAGRGPRAKPRVRRDRLPSIALSRRPHPRAEPRVTAVILCTP